MKYKVEGGVAVFGTDLVLQLSKEQASSRAHALEKVEGGHRPLSPVQFKAGEVLGVECAPDALPRPLAAVLVPQGSKATVSASRAARKRPSKKKEQPAPPAPTVA